MKITNLKDGFSIDFKNDVIYTLNDNGIDIVENNYDNGLKLNISNLTIIGKGKYSNLTFNQKVKLMVKLFKVLFL